MPEAVHFPAQLRRLTIRLQRSSELFVVLAAATSLLMGAVVLAGWLLGATRWTGVGEGRASMKADTALALVLASLALLLYSLGHAATGRRIRVGQVLGVAAAVIGLAALAGALFGVNLHIDDALVAGTAGATIGAPGRMSPYSAVALACIGAALAGAPVRRLRAAVLALAAAAALLGALSLVGPLWSNPERLADPTLMPVAAPAALAFTLLGLGLSVAVFQFFKARGGYRMLLDAIQLKLVASFAGAVLALVAVGGLAYDAAAEYHVTAERLARARALRDGLDAFHSETVNAALAQRTYLLTGDPALAQRWEGWVAELPRRRAWLAQVAREVDASEQEQLIALDQVIEELSSTLEAGVRLYQQQGPEAARHFVQSGRGSAALELMRVASKRLDALGSRQAEESEQLLLRGRVRIVVVSVLTWLVAAVLLGGAFLAIRREMQARSRSERELRRTSSVALAAHRFLNSVIQNIPAMIFIKEAKQLRFVLLNHAGEEIFGVQQADVLGKSDADFFPPEQAEHFVGRDREVLASGEVLDIPEEPIQSGKFGLRFLHTRKIPLRDENGRPTHLLGISEDVTAQREQTLQIRQLNQQLEARAAEVERLNQARSEFFATMSHEIRTPMHGMLGMLELLSLTRLESQQQQTLSVVRDSGRSLLRIINDILDFSKIEAERLELREEPGSLRAILSDIRNIHSAVASSHGVVVATVIDPALAPAHWLDAVRLRQVLNNFASNAVKFTREGQVELRAEVVGGREGAQSIRFSVADTGVGIAPEEQERLFNPFVQAGPGGHGGAAGTGLGLVIARRLVELMGGEVTLRSAVGEGTTISFVLELRNAPPELLPKEMEQESAELRVATSRIRPPLPSEQAAAEGTLILLVDDHPVNRMLLEQQLNTLGYTCESAHDGREALCKFQQGRFGLVLTDCQMPEMDGFELARRIRAFEAQHGVRRVPVIACTAAAGEVARSLEAGMDDCLVKPISLGRMREMLQEWLPLPAQAAQRGALDLEFIRSTWGGDVQMIEGIKESYASSARDDMRALREAVARRDAEATSQMAHRMLGASRMIGANAIGEACSLVNAASRTGDWEAVLAAMPAVEQEYTRVMRELEEEAPVAKRA